MKDTEFENGVRALEKENKMKVLKFYSNGCSPCRALTMMINSWGTPKYEVVEVDIKANPVLMKQFAVRGVPTMIKVDDEGKEIGRLVGMSPKVYPFLYE